MNAFFSMLFEHMEIKIKTLFKAKEQDIDDL